MDNLRQQVHETPAHYESGVTTATTSFPNRKYEFTNTKHTLPVCWPNTQSSSSWGGLGLGQSIPLDLVLLDLVQTPLDLVYPPVRPGSHTLSEQRAGE